MTTDSPNPSKSRPPKLGPRKASSQRPPPAPAGRTPSHQQQQQQQQQQPPTTPLQRKPSEPQRTPSQQQPQRAPSQQAEQSLLKPSGSAAAPRPPKLGPRKSSSSQAARSTPGLLQPVQRNTDSPTPSKPLLRGVPKLAPRADRMGSSSGADGQQAAAAVATEEQAQAQDSDSSLTTILDARQRTQLTILLAAATAAMRDNLSAAFEAETPEMARVAGMSEDERIMNAAVDPGTADVIALDKERQALERRRKEVGAPKMLALRKDAEDWFDTWREGVIGRVGEVVTSSQKAKGRIGSKAVGDAKPPTKSAAQRKINPADPDEPSVRPGGANEDAEAVLKELYPAVRTPLASLPKDERVLVLHSVLLLLLSMEHYASASRVLLLHLMASLDLSLHELKLDEDKTAQGLLQAAKELSADSEAQKHAAQNQRTRKWKVGLATAAGAAIVGVTGGMAAPMVAAGVGSMMGGLGLGTTAAAGYLGSVAGSSMLVGSLFGAYGGRMTGQMMDNYAKEVSDFAFIPVHSQKRSLLTAVSGGKSEEEAGKQDPSHRRLRVTIGISGWLTEKQEVVKPWTVLSQGSEAFALKWELEALMNLGNAMTELVQSAAWGYAQKELISHTIFAELTAAMWPLALVKAARVVDNPLSIAKSRAEKAGEVLADALINRAQGERPVNLIGYSLGARVIYSCLVKLAERRAFGLIENVVLIGAPLPSKSADWRKMRCVVAGRLVNVFSENDYVLGFLYRTSSIQYGIAGLQKIEGVNGVENVDVSQTVSGHLRYRFMVGSILKKIGFEDLDPEEIEREEKELKKMDEQEASRVEELTKKLPQLKGRDGKTRGPSEAEAEEEADQMQQNVESKTQSSLMQRGAELFHFGRDVKRTYDDYRKAYDDARDSSYVNYAKEWLPKRNENEKIEKEGENTRAAADQDAADSDTKDANAAKSAKRSYLNVATGGWIGSSGVKQKDETDKPSDNTTKGEQQNHSDEEAEPQEEQGGSHKAESDNADREKDEAQEETESGKQDEKKSRSYVQAVSASLPSFGGK